MQMSQYQAHSLQELENVDHRVNNRLNQLKTKIRNINRSVNSKEKIKKIESFQKNIHRESMQKHLALTSRIAELESINIQNQQMIKELINKAAISDRQSFDKSQQQFNHKYKEMVQRCDHFQNLSANLSNRIQELTEIIQNYNSQLFHLSQDINQPKNHLSFHYRIPIIKNIEQAFRHHVQFLKEAHQFEKMVKEKGNSFQQQILKAIKLQKQRLELLIVIESLQKQIYTRDDKINQLLLENSNLKFNSVDQKISSFEDKQNVYQALRQKDVELQQLRLNLKKTRDELSQLAYNKDKDIQKLQIQLDKYRQFTQRQRDRTLSDNQAKLNQIQQLTSHISSLQIYINKIRSQTQQKISKIQEQTTLQLQQQLNKINKNSQISESFLNQIECNRKLGQQNQKLNKIINSINQQVTKGRQHMSQLQQKIKNKNVQIDYLQQQLLINDKNIQQRKIDVFDQNSNILSHKDSQILQLRTKYQELMIINQLNYNNFIRQQQRLKLQLQNDMNTCYNLSLNVAQLSDKCKLYSQQIIKYLKQNQQQCITITELQQNIAMSLEQNKRLKLQLQYLKLLNMNDKSKIKNYDDNNDKQINKYQKKIRQLTLIIEEINLQNAQNYQKYHIANTQLNDQILRLKDEIKVYKLLNDDLKAAATEDKMGYQRNMAQNKRIMTEIHLFSQQIGQKYSQSSLQSTQIYNADKQQENQIYNGQFMQKQWQHDSNKANFKQKYAKLYQKYKIQQQNLTYMQQKIKQMEKKDQGQYSSELEEQLNKKKKIIRELLATNKYLIVTLKKTQDSLKELQEKNNDLAKSQYSQQIISEAKLRQKSLQIKKLKTISPQKLLKSKEKIKMQEHKSNSSKKEIKTPTQPQSLEKNRQALKSYKLIKQK